MDKDRILERLKKDLRSLLIASKDGLSIQELEHDYRMLIGSSLPVKSLEYRSTIEMLYDLQDVVTIQSKADGTITLIGVVNEETKGIAKLVSKQKTRPRKAIRKRVPIPRYHVDLVRRGRIAPVLPAAVKNDLQDLLSISPLLVSELETAFYNRFGRSFQYTRYGFYSLFEVLRSVSDLVQVNKTRAGSLLMLKTPYISGTFTETIKTPPRSLPPALIQDTSSNLLVEPTQVVETVSAGLVQTSMDCNLQELEEKMEKNFKLCLSKRAGNIISPELRQEIQNVVLNYPEGLSIYKFSVFYKEYTGKNLPFRELGFMSALDLVGSLGDMLYLESTKDGDLRLFDAVTQCKGNVTGKALLHNDNVSRWNSAAEKSEPVKPLVIKISSAEGNLMQIPQGLKFYCKGQEIPPDAVRNQKLHSLPCMKRGFLIGVLLENVTSPSEFYIRCYSEDTSQNLEDLMLEMRRCYENVLDRYVVPDNCVSVGEIYAVRMPGDAWWYRVIVHSVINSKEVQVYYPDYGHLTTVKRQCLRFLKACYMKLPAQAIPCSLAFVKPVEDQWSTEALTIFQQYKARGPLVGVVVQYVLGRLYLFLCDTSTDQDVYLHELLINRCLADMDQDPGYYKDLQQCNTFLHYLIQSSEQPQEESEEPTVLCEKNPAEKEAIIQPVNGCANGTDTDCLPPPLEEFDISLINCGPYGNSEIPQPITDHIPTMTPEEEKPSPQNRKSLVVFQESLSDNKATKGNSPHTGFQTFKISRSSTTMVLGPAARLAASPSTLLNWFSD